LNKLTKEQMKNVMGGTEDAEGTCYKCCPTGQPNSPQCSVASGPGSMPSCHGGGTPIETKCNVS
ncbi:MAG: hypothetical protein K2Q03_04420, partial [Sphingobacteriaceae bacterium]|nr:hypothetical protein [Sphingobacteriaceae bacterium]